MAKRKRSRAKQNYAGAAFGLSRRQNEKLKSTAEAARRRILNFMKRGDADQYIVPDAGEYTLASLLNRYAAGETMRSILRDARSVTAESIKSAKAPTIDSLVGYQITPKEYRELNAAVNKANANIRAAQRKYKSVSDILPKEFDVTQLARTTTGPEDVQWRIGLLKNYTAENLIPTSISEYGEAGTQAEYLYTRAILEKENERREAKRNMMDPRQQQGFFMQQADSETQDLDLSKITSIQELRTRSEVWDNYRRLMRANMFLVNYSNMLDLLEISAREQNAYFSDLEEQIKFIREKLEQYKNNEEAITYISNRIPGIDIALISGITYGDVDMDEIYAAWQEASKRY